MSGQKPRGRSPLAIVGLSCMFPGARDVREYWYNLREGIDSIREVPDSHWAPEDYYAEDPAQPDRTYGRRGGFLDPVDFDPMEFGISPRDLDATDTTQLLGLAVAKAALADAGYDVPQGKRLPPERTSVILGVTGALELVVPLGARLGHPVWRRALADAGVAPEVAEEVVERIGEQYPPWRESSFPGLLGNVAAGRIANRLNLLGTNCVVDAACASSLSALHMAALELETGRADVALAGGLDTFNDIFMYMCFSKTPALSPSGDARPFDADGDGTTLGEGLGVLVLKRLEDAERDGDRIYAVMRGLGSSSDGAGMAVYAPSDEGQARALRAAYDDAGVSPATVELVEAHGTGTRVGDAVEARGLTAVFREAQAEGTWAALGSAKSQIGHTKAAAGAAGLIKAVLALWHRVLPPTIKVETPNEAVAPGETPLYVNTTKRPWVAPNGHPRRAGVSSFGFGGTNFHCVLEEHAASRADQESEHVSGEERVQIVPLQGADSSDIVRGLEKLASGLDEAIASGRSELATLRALGAQARSQYQPVQEAATGHDGATCRLSLVLDHDGEDPLELLAEAKRLVAARGKEAWWSSPRGITWSRSESPREGKVGLVFAGQGSQRVGMLRDLTCQYDEMIETLDRANAALDRRLSDVIYPRPAFDQATERAQESVLRATRNAQPALGAVELGALAVLRRFGVKPVAALGHSYGELVALAAAGRLSEGELFELSQRRGNLMADVASAAGEQGAQEFERGSDPGSMLAVAADEDTVQAFLERHQLDLVVANRNAPTQRVLSGSTTEIERAGSLLEQDGLRGKRLDVAAAFHSPLVADAAAPFAEALGDVPFTQGSFPVWSNTSGEPYPLAPEEARALLGRQLASPVELEASIRSMVREGVDTFLEVGPGRTLCGLIKRILSDDAPEQSRGEAAVTMALDDSAGSRSGVVDLARVLAALATRGASIDLSRWDAAWAESDAQREEQAAKRQFTVKLSGANWQAPQTPRAPSPARRPDRAGPIEAERVATTVDASSMADRSPSHDAGLAARQETLRALMQLQQSTAEAHRQFLEQQERLARRIEALAAGMPASSLSSSPTHSEIVAPPIAEAPIAELPVVPSVLPEPFVAAAPATQSATSPSEDVSRLLLEVVSEKTGYPIEMLEPEMGLDADLGIDSIKRVEILSAMEERLPDLPRLEADRLGDLVTLADVAGALSEGSGLAGPLPAAPATHHSEAIEPPPAAPASNVLDVLLEVVSEKTGYPVEMLEPQMGLDADLGIDSIKRVEILSAMEERIEELPRLEADRLGDLVTLADVAQALSATSGAVRAPVAPPPAVAGRPEGPPVASPASAASDELFSGLLAVVAEKTGYPVEMLEPQMGLDADLGIDSIKRVEILSAMEERFPGLPRVDTERLGELQTLADVAQALASVSEEPFALGPSEPAPLASAGHAVTGNGDRSSAGGSQDVALLLLEVVAEKTGYPSEMLELGMGLDADLGIDSIKRVEILSAMEERLPGLARLETDRLGELVTLGDVVAALGETEQQRPAAELLETGDRNGAKGADGSLRSADRSPLDRYVLATHSASSPEALDLLPDGSRVWVTRSGDVFSAALVGALDSHGHTAELIDVATSASPPPDLAGLIIVAPSGLDAEASDRFLLRAFQLMQRVADRLRAAGKRGGALLATVSRQGGAFGLQISQEPSAAPEGFDPTLGAIGALARSARHEWPEVSCRVLDTDPSSEDVETTVRWLLGSGASFSSAEVGLSSQGAVSLELVAEPLPGPADSKPSFAADDVFVITGGARGVTAEAAVALVEAGVGSVALLGRTPLEKVEPAWLLGCETEAEMKRAILNQASDSGEGRIEPRVVLERYRGFAAQREIRSTLERLRTVGAKATYRSVDVRDQAAVAGATAAIAKELGPITGLVHGAGVLADRALEDKTEADWKRVYETKVHGYRALIAALREAPLRYLACFSSSTARFGRRGQIDYAVANDVLVRFAKQEASKRPDLSVVAIDWGPWAGGMVDTGLEALFSSEGVELIPLAAGGQQLVAELAARTPSSPLRTQHKDAVEVVVLGGGSVTPGQAGNAGEQEQTPAPRSVPAALPVASSPVFANGATNGAVANGSSAANGAGNGPGANGHGIAQDQPVANGGSESEKWSTELSRDVSVASHPFLESHVMNGRAVLPLAMMIEWLAHAALHPHPGKRFFGFDGLRVLKGLRLNGQTVTLALETGEVQAGKADPDVLCVPARLTSKNGSGRRIVHCQADILFADDLSPADAALSVPAEGSQPPAVDEIYSRHLFHGPELAGIQSIASLSEEGMVAQLRSAPLPKAWMDHPLRSGWLADPLALDVGFQLMIVWSQCLRGEGSLPAYVDSYRQHERRFSAARGGPLQAVVRVTESGERKACADIEWRSEDGAVVAVMRGYECVIDGSLNRAFARNTLVAAGSGQADPGLPGYQGRGFDGAAP